MAVFLLALYGLGTIGADVVHQTIHNHHSSEGHTSFTKDDPQHGSRSLENEEGGGMQETHFTNADTCKFSHIVFQAQQEAPNEHPPVILTEYTQVIFHHHHSFTAVSLTRPHLRGPPAC